MKGYTGEFQGESAKNRPALCQAVFPVSGDAFPLSPFCHKVQKQIRAAGKASRHPGTPANPADQDEKFLL
jgi:hypothetical protein